LPFEALAKEGEGKAGRDFQIETPYIPRRPFSIYHPRPPKMNLEICQDNLPATWKIVKSVPAHGNYLRRGKGGFAGSEVSSTQK